MIDLPIEPVRLWVYLASTPLLWLTLTVLTYWGCAWLQRAAKSAPLLNPVALSCLALIGFLLATGTDHPTYFEGAQFLHFLLGPATVALAVSLFRLRAELRQALLSVGCALLVGALSAAVSTVLLAAWFGLDPATAASMAPRSATAPVAMATAEKLGGVPALAAAVTVVTGMTGAVIAPGLLHLLRLRDPAAVGLAIGVASHGIGTAAAFKLGPRTGAFAALGFAANAVATPLIVAGLWPLASGWFAPG